MAAPDVFSRDILTSNIKWKGTTKPAINSAVKFNGPIKTTRLTPTQLLNPLPLQIYRREIASVSVPCNPRTSLLYQNDNPGQTIVTSYPKPSGLATTVNLKYDSSSCEHPPRANTSTTTCLAFQSTEQNALRRVRSAGMIQKKFNTAANNMSYCTDSYQYLTSRNRTFKQNQYFHIRQGDASAVPGTLGASANIYSANGVNHCPKFQVKVATSFTYTWIDVSNAQVTVNVPVGNYDITDFNNLFQSVMFKNNHYLINRTTSSPVFLMQFVYNGQNNRIELDSLTTAIYNTTNYNLPNIANWTINNTSGETPQVTLPSAPIFQVGLGYTPGTYPQSLANTTNQIIFGQVSGSLQPNYVPIYYKPNNPQFARQGAVSAGDLITRIRYNTINTAGNTFRTAFGKQTADAMAYGVPPYGYTLKDRVGFSIINTPVVNQYTGKLQKCKIIRTLRNLRNG